MSLARDLRSVAGLRHRTRLLQAPFEELADIGAPADDTATDCHSGNVAWRIVALALDGETLLSSEE